MKTTKLGSTGLEVSRLCLGCMTYGDPAWRPWILPEKEARAHLARAIELGFNFFDTADMYSNGASEEVTGKILKELSHREDYVLATKCFFPHADRPNRKGLSRKHILAACDASLKRLGHDYIDLFQIHRLDHTTPMEETVEALDSLVRAGKVRYLGASSMAAWEFATMLFLADRNGLHRFVSMQNHYNLVYREEERETIPLCLSQGIGLIPWSPLARGFLAGTRKREGKGPTARAENDPFADDMYFKDEDWDVVDALVAVAKEVGKKPAQVALAWLLSVPGVDAPIVGTTKLEQLEELVEAVDLKLGDEHIQKLEKPYRPHPILGHKQRTPRELGRK
ncbi:MAG TPA: aldo/keto reductase [Vicinamibacteria bacterium]|nr:aldo/keto reductase [Vicinamibacteria bacterium]